MIDYSKHAWVAILAVTGYAHATFADTLNIDLTPWSHSTRYIGVNVSTTDQGVDDLDDVGVNSLRVFSTWPELAAKPENFKCDTSRPDCECASVPGDKWVSADKFTNVNHNRLECNLNYGKRSLASLVNSDLSKSVDWSYWDTAIARAPKPTSLPASVSYLDTIARAVQRNQKVLFIFRPKGTNDVDGTVAGYSNRDCDPWAWPKKGGACNRNPGGWRWHPNPRQPIPGQKPKMRVWDKAAKNEWQSFVFLTAYNLAVRHGFAASMIFEAGNEANHYIPSDFPNYDGHGGSKIDVAGGQGWWGSVDDYRAYLHDTREALNAAYARVSRVKARRVTLLSSGDAAGSASARSWSCEVTKTNSEDFTGVNAHFYWGNAFSLATVLRPLHAMLDDPHYQPDGYSALGCVKTALDRPVIVSEWSQAGFRGFTSWDTPAKAVNDLAVNLIHGAEPWRHVAGSKSWSEPLSERYPQSMWATYLWRFNREGLVKGKVGYNTLKLVAPALQGELPIYKVTNDDRSLVAILSQNLYPEQSAYDHKTKALRKAPYAGKYYSLVVANPTNEEVLLKAVFTPAQATDLPFDSEIRGNVQSVGGRSLTDKKLSVAIVHGALRVIDASGNAQPYRMAPQSVSVFQIPAK